MVLRLIRKPHPEVHCLKAEVAVEDRNAGLSKFEVRLSDRAFQLSPLNSATALLQDPTTLLMAAAEEVSP